MPMKGSKRPKMEKVMRTESGSLWLYRAFLSILLAHFLLNIIVLGILISSASLLDRNQIRQLIIINRGERRVDTV
jgi:hypothetical protein